MKTFAAFAAFAATAGVAVAVLTGAGAWAQQQKQQAPQESPQPYQPSPAVARGAAYADTIEDLLKALRAGMIATDREQQAEIAHLHQQLADAKARAATLAGWWKAYAGRVAAVTQRPKPRQ